MSPTTAIVLDELVTTNRPGQFDLIEYAAAVLTACPAITDLLVRGSLATGTADRLSDLDFVVGIADNHFPVLTAALDTLAAVELGAILPGWRDTIVAPMGGLGYVYLLAHGGTLRQLDLYLVPTSRLTAVTQYTRAHQVFSRPGDPGLYLAGPASQQAHEFITAEQRRRPTCAGLLVEVLILGQMIRKRITRGQHFIAYAETHLLFKAVKNLIKTALAPSSTFYGWYHLPEEIGTTPLGRACLRDLADLVSGPAIPTLPALTESLERIITLAERAAPDAVDTIRLSLDAYRHYLEVT